MKTQEMKTNKFYGIVIFKFSLLLSFCMLATIGMSQDYEIKKIPSGNSHAIYMGNNGANTLVDGGFNLTTGIQNVFLGAAAGNSTTTTNGNTYVGHQAGFENSGSRNTMIGNGAGNGNVPSSGSDNVFIGYDAGWFEQGSDKLYISNSNTAVPLIKGDFAAKELTVNGDLQITGLITGELKPILINMGRTLADPGCTTSADCGKLWSKQSGAGSTLQYCTGRGGWVDLH